MTQMTEYGGHAHEMVANMSLQDLEAIDGILAVCHRLSPSYIEELYFVTEASLDYIGQSSFEIQTVHLTA